MTRVGHVFPVLLCQGMFKKTKNCHQAQTNWSRVGDARMLVTSWIDQQPPNSAHLRFDERMNSTRPNRNPSFFAPHQDSPLMSGQYAQLRCIA